MSDKWITIPGEPVAKPRQTRSDKWKQRPCVMRYRAWADEARKHSGVLPVDVFRVHIHFFLPMPKSWSKQRRNVKLADLHRSKPDLDNLIKSVLDALWPSGDSGICVVMADKRWDDGRGARTEVKFL